MSEPRWMRAPGHGPEVEVPDKLMWMIGLMMALVVLAAEMGCSVYWYQVGYDQASAEAARAYYERGR